MTSINFVHPLIGNTPLLEIKNIDTGPCQLFLKLEFLNLSGSLKDRMASYMIEAAERTGKLRPGYTIIEATSGNTALALAHVGILRGYKLLFVIHDKTSAEKIAYLKALGAKIVLTRHDLSRDHPDYYQNLAARLARETPNSFYTDQFSNPANPKGYEETLAPEIWHEMQQNIDAIICSAGSGGHMVGVANFMKRVSPTTKILLADPKGSVLAHYFKTKELKPVEHWIVEGIGEDCIHPNCDMSLLDDVITISDQESFAALFALLKKEAVFAGMSTGTVLAAALKFCRAQTEPKRVMTFAYDSGNRYISKICNKEWLKDNKITTDELQIA